MCRMGHEFEQTLVSFFIFLWSFCGSLLSLFIFSNFLFFPSANFFFSPLGCLWTACGFFLVVCELSAIFLLIKNKKAILNCIDFHSKWLPCNVFFFFSFHFFPFFPYTTDNSSFFFFFLPSFLLTIYI